jgi:hypothetical protein|tara:strand:+ start:105 stop:1196 length:1092 start_codon:yes stop_codon:yes gene_type:complete
MSKKSNKMSYYDSDFEVFHRWGSCDECGDATNEYDDDINDDNTPHEGVLILDENDGDDYKQLSFDFGEEDIRNKPDNQPAYQIRTLSIPEFAADFHSCYCGGSISESSFESYGFVDELAFNRGRFLSCSGGVFAEYGTLYGYQDVINHEVRIEEGGLVRTVSSNALLGGITPQNRQNVTHLIKETYNYKGELVDFYAHPLLEPFIENHLLTMPEKQVTKTSTEVVCEKIHFDELASASKKVNNERFIVDRESEWISDVNRNHLYLMDADWYDGVTSEWKTNRLHTVEDLGTVTRPRYEWGNCCDVYCGFVHEFWEGTEILKSRYYVWGGIVTNQPKLNYKRDGRLANVSVRIDGHEYLMWVGY